MKILIIDNDISTVTTLKALIMSQGDFDIDVAYNGRSGLEKMSVTPDYDVVLLDIMMPEISGMNVCESMVADSRMREIPVLLMSSALPISPAEFHASLVKSDKLSVIKGVLEKPFTTEDLLAEIMKVARKH